MAKIGEITMENFQSEVLNSPVPVLVDFTAVWCGPCKAMAPIVEQLAGEWGDKAKAMKCDIDQCMAIKEQYKVKTIPTMMIFKKGQRADVVVGMTTRDKLAKMMAKHI
jgi:thioredoxin 1